jgi:hypothetical protein
MILVSRTALHRQEQRLEFVNQIKKDVKLTTFALIHMFSAMVSTIAATLLMKWLSTAIK